MLMLGSVVAVLVFIAMAVDFASGVYKARLRGEARTSFAMQRSIIKFIKGEGSVVIAFCIDVMINLSNVWELCGLTLLENVPLVTIIIGAFCAFVELVSIREGAATKSERNAIKQLASIASVLSSDKMGDLINNLQKVKDLQGDELADKGEELG